MSSSVELAFSALILQLSAVLDAVSFFSAVEALVASWWGSFPLVLLLLVVPREGANVVGFWAWSYLRRFSLIHRSTWTSLLTCFGIHPIGLQVGANLLDSHQRGVIVCGASTG